MMTGPELPVMKPIQNRLSFRTPVLSGQEYVPDWSDIDRGTYLRLDRNEGTRPIPQTVAEAIHKYLDNQGVHTYPNADTLNAPLAEYVGVPAEFILATNGSDQAIDLTLRAFLGDGRTMLIAQPEFAVFSHVAGLTGAKVIGVPYDDDLSFPYSAFREAASQSPDLIAIINPNNPTGTPVDIDFIEEIVVNHPNTPVVVDEAYYEFTGKTVAPLTKLYENLIVLRTFSKAFAMAGLRLGYLIASPVTVAEITKLRNPFDVNEIAVVAGCAHLQDLGSMQEYVAELTDVIKPTVVQYFDNAGIKVWPGAANFVLVKPENCQEAINYLHSARILVRPMKSPLIAGTFRMSLGSVSEMATVMNAYDHYLSGVRRA